MKKLSGQIVLPVCLCLRCNKSWNPRTTKHPTVCPRCHSPYWHLPRKGDMNIKSTFDVKE